MYGTYFPRDINPFNHFMTDDEVDNHFIHNIDKVISYLIKNTDAKYNTPNYEILLLELFNHFHQMHQVLMSHYDTWRFKYDRIYFTMASELPHRILIAAINNEDRITSTEKESLEHIMESI